MKKRGVNRFTPHFFQRQPVPVFARNTVDFMLSLEAKEALMIEHLGMAKSNLRGVFSTINDLDKVLRC